MRKRIFITALMAAFLLGWTDGLQAKYRPAAQGNQALPAVSGHPASPENSGEQGQDGEDAAAGDEKSVAQPDENGPGQNGEAVGGGNGGEGDGGNSGGRGDNSPPAKKASYKDSVARAAKYTARKQYASAAREYNKALTALSEDDGRKVFVYERQGWLALMGNDIPGAESLYLAAIYQAEKIETFDKSAVNAYRGAAYCYEKDGELSSAVENYRLALKHAADKATKADLRKKLQRLQAGKKKKAR